VENNSPISPGSNSLPNSTGGNASTSTPNPFASVASINPQTASAPVVSQQNNLQALPPLPSQLVSSQNIIPIDISETPTFIPQATPVIGSEDNLNQSVDSTVSSIQNTNLNSMPMVNPGSVIIPSPNIHTSSINPILEQSAVVAQQVYSEPPLDFSDTPTTILIESSLENPSIPPQFVNVEKHITEAPDDDSGELPPPVMLIEPPKPLNLASQVTPLISSNYPQPEQNSGKEKSKYAVLIAILALVLVLLLAFVGYLVFQLVNLPSDKVDVALEQYIDETQDKADPISFEPDPIEESELPVSF